MAPTLTRSARSIGCALGAALGLCAPHASHAQAAINGLSGLIAMPSARMEPDGTAFIGGSFARPYVNYYAGLQAMPWLQLMGSYARVMGVPGGPAGPEWANYGDKKDKSAGFKLRLLQENQWGQGWLPEVSAGVIDRGFGTSLFSAEFVAASKKFPLGDLGTLDATVGYGRDRIAGPFGGMRFQPKALPSWALVAEYDANDYNDDHQSGLSGLRGRKTGTWNAAIEYKTGPFHIQVGEQFGKPIVNAYFSIPLEKGELTPKVDETGPLDDGAWYSDAARPTAVQWDEDRAYRQAMIRALYDEGFRSVRFAYRDGVMSIRLASGRFQYASRAVGRAARIALAYMPWETRRLDITWELADVPAVTYRFDDVPTLQRYFAGTATRNTLAGTVQVLYAKPDGEGSAAYRANDIDQVLDAVALEKPRTPFFGGQLTPFGYATESYDRTRFSIGPYLSTYFNDPSGAFKYDVGLAASASLHLGRGLWGYASVRQSISEDISDVRQGSNSTLPHVRSDVAKYFKASRFKVSQLLLSKYWQPAARTYARISGGLYEDMFGGAGGQAMWLAPGGRFAVDGSFDHVWQRDYRGTGFLGYQVNTFLVSAHYRTPWWPGVTFTARAGRFLAGDEGVRGEVSRTFRSGVQVGIWYTVTNGHDTTTPGTPSSPYQDKGVFVRIPLATMITRDTAAAANFAIQPWTRDVGAMVDSPGDLYDMFERGVLSNVQDGEPLREFGDVQGEDRP